MQTDPLQHVDQIGVGSGWRGGFGDPRRPARRCKVFRHRRVEGIDPTDLPAKGESRPSMDLRLAQKSRDQIAGDEDARRGGKARADATLAYALMI